MAICESCKKPHPQLIEVKATAHFFNRKNEWTTYFCPRCLDYVQKQEDIIKWAKQKKL